MLRARLALPCSGLWRPRPLVPALEKEHKAQMLLAISAWELGLGSLGSAQDSTSPWEGVSQWEWMPRCMGFWEWGQEHCDKLKTMAQEEALWANLEDLTAGMNSICLIYTVAGLYPGWGWVEGEQAAPLQVSFLGARVCWKSKPSSCVQSKEINGHLASLWTLGKCDLWDALSRRLYC